MKTEKLILNAYSEMIEEAKMKTPHDSATITIVGHSKEFMKKLSKMILYLQDASSVGHSFEILIDPNYHNKKEKIKKFKWEGDGSDKILSIELDGKKVK